MSQDNKVVLLQHRAKLRKNDLSDHEKVVFAYHYFEQNNHDEAVKLLSSVSGHYYESGLHKDISRALLCHATYASTQNPAHGKESEFYLVVYRLVRHITHNKIHFTNSGHFYLLKDYLFKDFM